MRYFFDTEFMDHGDRLELISIGVVCEDGREYHAGNARAQLGEANAWVREHVIAHLPEHDGFWKTPDELRDDLAGFFKLDLRPELWAWYASCDFVLLCQLFGGLVNLPVQIPQYCMDLKQYATMLGATTLPVQTGRKHDALEDARWNADVYKFLRSLWPGGEPCHAI